MTAPTGTVINTTTITSSFAIIAVIGERLLLLLPIRTVLLLLLLQTPRLQLLRLLLLFLLLMLHQLIIQLLINYCIFTFSNCSTFANKDTPIFLFLFNLFHDFSKLYLSTKHVVTHSLTFKCKYMLLQYWITKLPSA